MRLLNIELIEEIYFSIRQNKTRTFLSGFGISWGILILVILLGTGKGFQEAIMNMLSAFAQKSIYVYGGVTSMKYHNIKEGRTILFDAKYLQFLKSRYPEIEAISPEVSAFIPVQSGDKTGSYKVCGVNDEYMHIRILRVKEEGRLINKKDMEQKRNVAIIGEQVAKALFGRKDALHQQVNISGLYYTVIGILRNEDIFGAAEINSIYVPISSYQANISGSKEFNAFCLCLTQDTDSKAFESNLKGYISHQSDFSVKDDRAVYISNFETQTSAFENLFKGIRLFIWGVGICFLISGIVGICNIMLVVVKERTNEIGIRLAVGAIPRSIIQLMLFESIAITTVSGIVGLIIGKGVLMFIDWLLTLSESNLIMQKTDLDFQTAIVALAILVVSGIAAGAFPAIKAANIEPVDAIRYENRG
ncbi:MAG: ABC transporter permease [Mediterranea sp.]|jgi:putative ABC transport system permease protein|nr:ABC transporter permease [Mediterranea sp.]